MSSTTTAPKPRNPGTSPTRPRKLFLNIPVKDLQRSIDFSEALGFTFNAQFTDASGAAMLIGEDAYSMLLTEERFKGFSQRPLGDRVTETNALFALGVQSRDEVDAMVTAAVAAGGSYAVDAQDHGFMYGLSFRDFDQHHWEVFWMDPAAVNSQIVNP